MGKMMTNTKLRLFLSERSMFLEIYYGISKYCCADKTLFSLE